MFSNSIFEAIGVTSGCELVILEPQMGCKRILRQGRRLIRGTMRVARVRVLSSSRRVWVSCVVGPVVVRWDVP